jgi:hypothetical protein
MRPLVIPTSCQDLVLPYFELVIRVADLSDAKFGVQAVNDHRFMSRLRTGQVNLRTVNRALDYARREAASWR